MRVTGSQLRGSRRRFVEERSIAEDHVLVWHVTGYFKEHPDFVPIAYIPVHPDHQFGGARISVDTPADLRFLEEVYARLGVAAGEADSRDVVKLLRNNGFNTCSSCHHEMSIQCEYHPDGAIQHLHNLLFNNGFRNYQITMMHEVVNGHSNGFIEVYLTDRKKLERIEEKKRPKKTK